MSWSDVPPKKQAATEIVNEAAGPAETEDNEAGMSTEEKETRREKREDWKYQVLVLAHAGANKDGIQGGQTTEEVVARAKAYYSFVTGKGSRKKEG